MNAMIDDTGLDILFRAARTHNIWREGDISNDVLERIWDITKMGPTSANCSPARIVFVRSRDAKERLRPCLAEGNIEKSMTAPVTAIIGNDLAFYERLPELFPHTDARSWFVGNDDLIEATASRNGTLQGAYFMLAARALGLDCGPMSGFDHDKIDAEFFSSTSVRSNFLCNIGLGDGEALFPRAPRLAFDDACRVE